MIDRLLVMLFAACAALVGLIVVEVASGDAELPAFEPSVAQGENPAKARVQRPRAEDLVAAALTSPLFSPTRRPPEHSEPQTAADTELPDVRLAGIVIEPDRRIAIFAAAGAKPFARSEGEMLDAWRLDSISAQEVSLSGPAGTRMLTPQPDTSLVRPSASTRAATAQPKPGAAPSGAGRGIAGGIPPQPAATGAPRRPPVAPSPATPLPVGPPANRPPGGAPVANPANWR